MAPSGARPAALAEAFSAVQDDVAAIRYNPASLSSLRSTQLGFIYQEGLIDDAEGQVVAGRSTARGGVGLSLGFYDGGKIDVLDGGPRRSVQAQTDLTMAVGYARRVGAISAGLAGKYISSELIDQYRAQAVALDLGVTGRLWPKTALGASLQNIGTRLTYSQEGDELPLLARAGVAQSLFRERGLLVADLRYLARDREMSAAVGFEYMTGPLALRGGYTSGSDLVNVSLGAGFLLRNFSIDYSYGIADELNSPHRVSVTVKFDARREAGILGASR